MHPVFIFLVFLIIAAVVVVFSYLRNQRRRQELSQLALQLGWQFDPGKDHSFESRYPQFSIFARGDSRYAYNTLSGQLPLGKSPCPVVMGDYHYEETTGSGDNRSTHNYHFSYAIFQLPVVCPGDLTLRREQVFDKLAAVFGFDDIDFESAEFSRHFCVKGSDKKFAYDVIHPRMMEFLLANDPPTISLAGNHCCLSEGNRCWSPHQFRANLTWGQEFYSLWPRYLVEALADQAQARRD